MVDLVFEEPLIGPRFDMQVEHGYVALTIHGPGIELGDLVDSIHRFDLPAQGF